MKFREFPVGYPGLYTADNGRDDDSNSSDEENSPNVNNVKIERDFKNAYFILHMSMIIIKHINIIFYSLLEFMTNEKMSFFLNFLIISI